MARGSGHTQSRISSKSKSTPATLDKDVSAPMTDDDLNSALEDSFPASDPINFAGSIAGPPADKPRTASVGPHPMAGAEEARKKK